MDIFLLEKNQSHTFLVFTFARKKIFGISKQNGVKAPSYKDQSVWGNKKGEKFRRDKGAREGVLQHYW